MKLPQVKQCCCWCTLETGSQAIALTEIACSILYILSNVASLMFGSDVTLGETSPDHSRSVGFLVSHIIIGLLQLALGVVLLIGTKKRLPKYLNIVVIVGFVELCIFLPVIIVQLTLSLIAAHIMAATSLFLLQVSLLVLKLYLLIVISSFRKEILSEIKGVV